MPYFHMKEIWTPLKLIGIRFFIETESGNIYIKLFKGHRKRWLQRDKESK